MNERERLLSILHANPGNPRANDLLAELAAHPEATIARTAPLPHDHALTTLRKRAEMSAAGLTRAGDYQAPLASLAASSSPTVVVESVTIGDRDWVILTTPRGDLIDVLCLAAR